MIVISRADAIAWVAYWTFMFVASVALGWVFFVHIRQFFNGSCP